MEISVVLAYYKNLPALELVLSAFNNQTFRDFDMIVAEDDNSPDTSSFLEANRERFFYPVIHLNQEMKRGFRKTTMLNKAIRSSSGSRMVFIDGDCIPHQRFLNEYHKRLRKGEFLFGRRVLLGKNISGKILKKRSLSPLRYVSILLSDSRRKKEGVFWPFFDLHLENSNRKLSGHNWGIHKDDILTVNGFDEDYIRPGVGEDYDIEWRLKAAGLKMRSIKNRAIVYHLHHPKTNSEENARYNDDLLINKTAAGHIRCINGLVKLNESF